MTDNSCTKQGNVGIKSAIYNQERVIMARVWYLFLCFLRYFYFSQANQPTCKNGPHAKSTFPALQWTCSRDPLDPYDERALLFNALRTDFVSSFFVLRRVLGHFCNVFL